MKKLLIFAIGFLAYPLFVDVVDIASSVSKSKDAVKLYYKVWMPSYGLSKPFTKDCTKDVSKNGHGWVFVNREYYKCNKVQIAISDLIFGEKTR